MVPLVLAIALVPAFTPAQEPAPEPPLTDADEDPWADELFDDGLDALLGGDDPTAASADADSSLRSWKGFFRVEPRFFLRQHHDTAGPVGEPLKHALFSPSKRVAHGWSRRLAEYSEQGFQHWVAPVALITTRDAPPSIPPIGSFPTYGGLT